jgi:orotate phosphoribosyltransferase
MEPYQIEFVEFMVGCEALRFGDFVTKSGRSTPFFINTGQYDSGSRIRRLGGFYADAIHAGLGEGIDLLFGPAYKGIPLVTAAAAALAERHGRDIPFAFDRKEAKDHGEGGSLIGRAPRAGDRVVLVDDVVTAGTSVRHSVGLLRRTADVTLAGLVVSVDRQERCAGENEADGRSALDAVADEFGLRAVAIVTLDQIVAHLHNRPIDGRVVLDDAMLNKIHAYRRRYGVETG